MADFTKINGVFAKDTVLRAGISDVQSYIGYPQADIYGLCADFENYTFTRLAGAVGKTGGADFSSTAPWSGMRRCVLADNGTVVAYYGEQGYVEDGTAGQVMVEIPKFYYRVVPLKLEKQTPESATDTNRLGYHLLKANYYISPVQYEGFKLHPVFFNAAGQEVDKVYMSAYEGSIYDVSAGAYLMNDEQVGDFTEGTGDKLCSIAGVRPCSGIGQQLNTVNIRKIAANRGAGWYQLNIKMVSAIQLLCAIEYASFNWQALMGYGVTGVTVTGTNAASFTGSTSYIGNSSGQASSTIDYTGTAQTAGNLTSVTYRGIENFIGNLFKFNDGINIWGDGTMAGGSAYIASDMNFETDKKDGNYINSGFTLTNANGYIKYFGYGNEQFDWLFCASKTGDGATYSMPVGDQTFVTSNVNVYRIDAFGGYFGGSVYCGGYYHYFQLGSTTRSHQFGGRLTYIA